MLLNTQFAFKTQKCKAFTVQSKPGMRACSIN